jgi:hypothetical protein
MKKIFVIISMVVLTQTIFCQVPESINYQAVLRDASGNVRANANVSIEIALLKGSLIGTPVFSETHSKTTNEFGLINLEIGSVNTSGFSSIDWANGPYFIKVGVDGLEYGTSQLLSVPYALHAKTADSITAAFTEADPIFTAWDKNYNDLANKPTLFGGSYNNLTNKPVLFDGQYSSLTGEPTLWDSTWTSIKNKPVLFTGSFDDLSNKPTTTTGYGITDAFSGDYNDLTNKPNIRDTILNLNIPPGTVIQTAVRTSEVTSSLNTATFTEANPDYRVSIVPRYANSIFLIEFSFSINTALSSNTVFHMQLVRDIGGTETAVGVGPTNSGRNRTTFVSRPSNGYDTNDMQNVYMIAKDSGLTAGTTYAYGFKYRRENGGSGTCYFNYNSFDSSAFGFSGVMTMKITEIAQ